MKIKLKMLLFLAAILGTFGFAAAQTTTPAPVAEPIAAITNAPPASSDSAWRFQRRHLDQLRVVAKTAEETLGADHDADRILAGWAEDLRGIADAVKVLAPEPPPAAAPVTPTPAPVAVPEVGPAGIPAKPAVTAADHLDQVQAHLRLAAGRLEQLKAELRPASVAGK